MEDGLWIIKQCRTLNLRDPLGSLVDTGVRLKALGQLEVFLKRTSQTSKGQGADGVTILSQRAEVHK